MSDPYETVIVPIANATDAERSGAAVARKLIDRADRPVLVLPGDVE